MKCPYSVNSTANMISKFVYDDNGINTQSITTQITKDEFRDCIKKECAAFRRGKCRYKG